MTKLEVKLLDMLEEEAAEVGRLMFKIEKLTAENAKLRHANGIELDAWIPYEPSHLSIIR